MAELTPGMVLGKRFEIAGVLGQGGMATVYLARDRLREEKVALKILHDHLTSNRSMRDRLRREVLAASRLRHPNALVASELHELDGHLALSLPLHNGSTLLDHVAARGALGADELVSLGCQLAEALSEAHRHGIIHRDITPSNVMIDENGDGCLTDFGLARLEDLRSATATGVIGTCGYAAPEVYEGVRADPRADVYSLGTILYLAATGKAPFEAANPMGVLQKQLQEDYLPLSECRPELPPPLVEALEKMLHRDPDLRPQGAREALELLRNLDEADDAESTEAISEVTSTQEGSIAEALVSAGYSSKGGTGRADLSSRVAEQESSPLLDAAAQAGEQSPQKEPPSESRPSPIAEAEQRSQERGLTLPPGNWTVVISEVRGDRRRRRRTRRRSRRHRGRWRRQQRRMRAGFGDIIQEVQENMSRIFRIPDTQLKPEERLARAVALEAGLAEDALALPATVYSKKFRLVDGVDYSTADRLVTAATLAGFRARAFDQASSASNLTPPIFDIEPRKLIPAAILLAIILQSVAIAVIPFIILCFAIMAVLGIKIRPLFSFKSSLERLPLAYGKNLRPYLDENNPNLLRADAGRGAEKSAFNPNLLRADAGRGAEKSAFQQAESVSEGRKKSEPSASREATEVDSAHGRSTAGRVSTDDSTTQGPVSNAETPDRTDIEGQTPAPASTETKADSAKASRVTSIVKNANIQIDAFERALKANETELPEVMLEDLQRTVSALRAQSDKLGAEAQRLEKDLHDADDPATSAAASRIEARLTRLRTLDRDGQKVDPQEIASLESGLEAHRSTLELVEALETRSTLTIARLLEIGAAANQARRELRKKREPEKSALRLLDQLRAEVSAAADALKEVDGDTSSWGTRQSSAARIDEGTGTTAAEAKNINKNNKLWHDTAPSSKSQAEVLSAKVLEEEGDESEEERLRRLAGAVQAQRLRH